MEGAREGGREGEIVELMGAESARLSVEKWNSVV